MSGTADQNGLLHNNENSGAVGGQCCSCQGSSAVMSPPADWRRNGILTDVTLIGKAFGGGKLAPKEAKIPAHKLILAMHSDFFRKKFEHDMTVAELFVPSVDPDNLLSLVRYIYREGGLNLDETNVERLYIDADFLNFNEARQTCLDYMHRNINANNWAKRLKFCRQETLKELGRLINEFVATDYLACLKSSLFDSLNVFEVIAFLRLPARCSCPEHEILLHLLNWVRRNPLERASYTSILLKELNLAALPEQLLYHYFSTEPLLNRYDTNRLYKAALTKKGGHAGRLSEGGPGKRAIRPSVRLSQQTTQLVPLSLPGDNGEVQVNQVTNGTSACTKIELAGSSTVKFEPASLPNKRPSSATRTNSPCRRGGEEHSPPQPAKLARQCSPDINDMTYEEVETMSPTNESLDKRLVIYLRQSAESESQIMAADLDSDPTIWEVGRYTGSKFPEFIWVGSQQRLYSLGGLKRGRCCPDVSFTFSNMSNENTPLTWFKGSPMKSSRINFHPVLVGQYIYAFGGSKTNEPQLAINLAERLSLLGDNPHWEEIESMHVPRESFGAAVLNGNIFVCGGYGGSNHSRPEILNSVERYDPETNKWELVAEMNHSKFGLSCVVLDGKLYAIGGSSQEESLHEDVTDVESMKTAEMYDPEKNCWTMVAPLIRPRRNGCAMVLQGKIYAIGGDRSVTDDHNQVLSSVEVYDPKSGKWDLYMDALDEEGTLNSFVVMGDANEG